MDNIQCDSCRSLFATQVQELSVLLGRHASGGFSKSLHQDGDDEHEDITQDADGNKRLCHRMFIQPNRASKCENAGEGIVDDTDSDHAFEDHILSQR